MMNRRSVILGTALAVTGKSISANAAMSDIPVTVFLSPSCGCCKGWVAHLQASGFKPDVKEVGDVTPQKWALGVPQSAWSCHTALIGDYFIEGHVPASDIRRLLAEKPLARGLAVPEMPVGSPGMEAPGQKSEPYETILVLADGTSRVWQKH